MPSPFPGMNPYLEQNDTWEDFHQNFITRIQEALSASVGLHYLVKIAKRMSLVLPTVDTMQESYIAIYAQRERRVVTVMELLSPANKTSGADHAAYLGKRRSLLASRVHFVEIDLRRGGVRPQPPELPLSDYYALVCRYHERPRVDVWPIALRDRLPTILVPLTPPDADVPLDLQELLHRVYDAAGYAKYIYDEEPHPPLVPGDAAWVRQFLPH